MFKPGISKKGLNGIAVTSSLIIVGLACVAVSIALLHSNGRRAQPIKRPCGKHQPGWIVGASTFTQFEANGASQALIDRAFNNNCTYVFGKTPSSIGVPTAYYQSYQAIKAAFADGTLPGGFKAVMYDNEGWAFTPPAEQRNPAKYERLVAQLLHRHGLLYIATPGASLTRASGTLINNNNEDTYLARNIAGMTARYANVIDIQAQILQPNIAAFTLFATAAAQQARAANPKIKVYIGIATGPEGEFVTEQNLYRSYRTVRRVADGYWLNLSAKSSHCRLCTAPRPRLAVELLERLYGSGSFATDP
jgi:hypothetical protein